MIGAKGRLGTTTLDPKTSQQWVFDKVYYTKYKFSYVWKKIVLQQFSNTSDS